MRTSSRTLKSSLRTISRLKQLWRTCASASPWSKRGAQAVFEQLSQDLQRRYLDVALVEVAAFANFQRQYSHGAGATGQDSADVAWSYLDNEAMAEWTPERPLEELAADPHWAPLVEHELRATAPGDQP